MSETKYIVTWSRGSYDDAEQGVAFWCDAEAEADEATRILNAEVDSIKTWYRAWCDENPWPREDPQDEWRARRDAAVEERIRGTRVARFLSPTYSFNYGGVIAPHFSVVDVEKWAP